MRPKRPVFHFRRLINEDCHVNFLDLAPMAAWLVCTSLDCFEDLA
jgi:hypothetical protein